MEDKAGCRNLLWSSSSGPASSAKGGRVGWINVPKDLPENLNRSGVGGSDGQGYLPYEDCCREILWPRPGVERER